MGCKNFRKCIECNSEVARIVVEDSRTARVTHIRNWGSENTEHATLAVKKHRYDPRNRCYYHLKKFLARKAVKAAIRKSDRERR